MLDVGSTTTKAIILRIEDNQTLASVYLRTHGNPVASSRACYAQLIDQLQDLAEEIRIVGVGVTGSGRQIAGLHAMTDGIINEIIAHAAGALFYDKEVVPSLKSGGQDAKYTFHHQRCPGGLCHERGLQCRHGLISGRSGERNDGDHNGGHRTHGLAGAKAPPNFNDQCAAFISSDIKNAFHENINTGRYPGSLVYSICMNYDHRVKGYRPMGKTDLHAGRGVL